jgi:hypothetical protein
MSLTILPERTYSTSSYQTPIGATRMLYSHNDGTASLCRTYNIFSTEVKEVVSFIKKWGMLCHGFQIVYGVRNGEVVELTKQGYMAQKDIRPLIEMGFTEFFMSNTFATKKFLLATGEIVSLGQSLEANPKKITATAIRMRGLFGY